MGWKRGAGAVLAAGMLWGSARAATPELDRGSASRFAGLVLGCARREFPNKMDHVMNGPGEVKGPRDLHPSFYGCFDWHSAVHGHWMLARLLRTCPDLPEAGEIRRLMDEDLAPERVALEVAYFNQEGRRSFERTYGWAWLLKLAAELESWKTPEAQRWAGQLRPLTDAVAGRLKTFLPKQTYPIRVGAHPNTAFTLSLALDFAQARGDEGLRALVQERARAYYFKDRSGPWSWEPASEDFLSPCLEEAALMSKVLPPKTFRPWLAAFLPGLLAHAEDLKPAQVSDRSDPKIVHLDGLNLSRARALRELAGALAPGDPRRAALERSALRHAQASLPHIATGNYEGEHWLATFAVRYLDQEPAKGAR